METPQTTGLNNVLFGYPLGRHQAEIVIEMIFCIAILVASITGNALVILIVNKNTRLKTINNMFIQNLALTDICMATFHMPLWCISIYYGKWIFNQQTCEYEASTMFTFGSASILTMALISTNRYFKIVRPQIYKNIFCSKKIVVIYCFLVWIVGVFFALPPTYGWGIYQYHTRFMACSLVWELEHMSFVVIFLGGFVNGVTITIFVCYYKIYKVVQQSSRNLAAHIDNTPVASIAEVKILKSTFAVVCGYVICWMPVTIVCLTETVGGKPPRIVYAVAIFLMYSSSCINPIIYGIMNPQFRKAFTNILRCQGFNSEDNNAQGRAATGSNRQPSVITVRPVSFTTGIVPFENVLTPRTP